MNLDVREWRRLLEYLESADGGVTKFKSKVKGVDLENRSFNFHYEIAMVQVVMEIYR